SGSRDTAAGTARRPRDDSHASTKCVSIRRRSHAERCRGERHVIAGADVRGGLDDGVHAGTRVEPTGHLDPVVAGECAQDVVVLGEVVLGERGHYAARVGQEDGQADAVTDLQGTAGPRVLDEPFLRGVDDDVHAEPTVLEATLGAKRVELGKSRGGEHRYWEQIEERAGRDG